ncbi:hypothetical protein BBR01nite_00900 [Brevibacillus brevis]|nr:hypothetical protein BBR01nite_00900 [Brevibacillus brevis]
MKKRQYTILKINNFHNETQSNIELSCPFVEQRLRVLTPAASICVVPLSNPLGGTGRAVWTYADSSRSPLHVANSKG